MNKVKISQRRIAMRGAMDTGCDYWRPIEAPVTKFLPVDSPIDNEFVIKPDQLDGAPGFDKNKSPDMADPTREAGIHSYYGTTPGHVSSVEK